MQDERTSYDTDYTPVWDLIWGRGFISPGGEGCVDKTVEDVDLQGKRVLELGSGSGGGAMVLASKYGAEVVGIDTSETLVVMSRQRVAQAQLADKIEFRFVKPGLLPFEDESFDVFYTSGVICHIEDREELFREVLRVLKPGGWLLGYDWFPTVMSDDIIHWMKAGAMNLFPDSPERYANKMREAGFSQITYYDASRWYQIEAEKEIEALTGPLFDKIALISSPEIRDYVIDEWTAVQPVLQSGDLRTGYFRGRKPEAH